jgi:hypothetical protein
VFSCKRESLSGETAGGAAENMQPQLGEMCERRSHRSGSADLVDQGVHIASIRERRSRRSGSAHLVDQGVHIASIRECTSLWRRRLFSGDRA